MGDLNWVERRAAKERTIRDGALGVWASVRSALLNACDSFNKQYQQLGDGVVWNLENCTRIQITVPVKEQDRVTVREVMVLFNGKDRIRFATDTKSTEITLKVLGEEVFVIEPGTPEKSMSADKTSEYILKDVFFGVGESRTLQG